MEVSFEPQLMGSQAWWSFLEGFVHGGAQLLWEEAVGTLVEDPRVVTLQLQFTQKL